MSSNKHHSQRAAAILTFAAILLRLVPHPPNFSPAGAAAIFAGGRLKGWIGYLVPLLAMMATDPILSYLAGYPAYSSGSLVVYSSLLVNVFLGRKFLEGTSSLKRIGAVTVTGSIQFFLVTNFFVWLQSPSLYPHTGSGIVECYVAALPFFQRTLLSDLFYSAVLFTAHAALNRQALSRQTEC
jgi:hypothetical protein